MARGDPLSVFATHEPSVWLQVNKATGEVDWRATTAMLNLLSAAQVGVLSVSLFCSFECWYPSSNVLGIDRD